MSKRHRGKGGNRSAGKSHAEKRRRIGSEQLSLAVQKAHRSEDLAEIKNFIQKALDFGVQSGFLMAKDESQRLLRVSSELMHDAEGEDKVANDEKDVSRERDRSPLRTASKQNQNREQEVSKRSKKRRRSRRRSRSGSKKRPRKSRRNRVRSRSQVPERPTENCEDLDVESVGRDRAAEDADGNLEDTQIVRSDGEKNLREGDDEESESSTGDEDSDDEKDKQEDDDTNKS